MIPTNAYRNLTYGKEIKTIRQELDAITSAEESKWFQVFMAPVPCIKFYSHLANLADPAFVNCLNAVVASYIHTRIDRRPDAPKLIPQYLVVVSRHLFQNNDIEEDQVVLFLNELAAKINATPTVSL